MRRDVLKAVSLWLEAGTASFKFRKKFSLKDMVVHGKLEL